MMIGPEPITMTLLMSSRFGIHQLHKTVEEVRRVVRSGGGLGVVLDGEALEPPGVVAQLETLHDVVVEAYVTDARLAVGGRGAALQGCVDREAVVVRGDLDLPGGAVHHRLV